MQVCLAVSLDDNAAVDYINRQNFPQYLDLERNQKQCAVAVLKPPGVTFDEIPSITGMKPMDISDASVARLYSGQDSNVFNELRGKSNEHVKAWKADTDGGEVVVIWAKPQAITDKNGKNLIRPIHSEARLFASLQDEMTQGKKLHLLTKNSPCEECATAIVDFKKKNDGMQMHLHHDDMYVPKGQTKVQGADQFEKSSARLSQLDSDSHDFTWSTTTDMKKIADVRKQFGECKYQGFTTCPLFFPALLAVKAVPLLEIQSSHFV